MSREQVLSTLRDAVPELRREFPIRSLALFGSVARGDENPDSDVDILVEFDPDAHVTLFTLSRLLDRLSSLLGRNVDLIENHPGLSEAFRESLGRDLCRVA